MQKAKLTKSTVDSLKLPVKGQLIIWDSNLIGFGIRLTQSTKSYIVQARVNGKTRRVKLGRHGTLTTDQARIEAKIQLADMAKGIDPVAVKQEADAKKTTLVELWNDYKAARSLKPKTISVYEGALNRCFSDWLEKPFLSITKDKVQLRHKQISNNKGPRSNETGSQAQANQAMRVLRSLLNFAAAQYEDADGKSLLPENPVRRLTQTNSWNRNKRRTSVVKKSELQSWYKAVSQLQSSNGRDFLLLCLFTGLRSREAAELKWSDVDFKEKTLTIVEERSKNNEEHILPLSTYVFDILKSRFDNKVSSPYVFPGKNDLNKPMVECKRSVERVKKLSGVNFMIHDLRRTFITIGEAIDTPHYTLKRLANHKMQHDVTAGYISLNVDRLRQPMQAITDYILDAVELQELLVQKSNLTVDSSKEMIVSK